MCLVRKTCSHKPVFLCKQFHVLLIGFLCDETSIFPSLAHPVQDNQPLVTLVGRHLVLGDWEMSRVCNVIGWSPWQLLRRGHRRRCGRYRRGSVRHHGGVGHAPWGKTEAAGCSGFPWGMCHARCVSSAGGVAGCLGGAWCACCPWGVRGPWGTCHPWGVSLDRGVCLPWGGGGQWLICTRLDRGCQKESFLLRKTGYKIQANNTIKITQEDF